MLNINTSPVIFFNRHSINIEADIHIPGEKNIASDDLSQFTNNRSQQSTQNYN